MRKITFHVAVDDKNYIAFMKAVKEGAEAAARRAFGKLFFECCGQEPFYDPAFELVDHEIEVEARLYPYRKTGMHALAVYGYYPNDPRDEEPEPDEPKKKNAKA